MEEQAKIVSRIKEHVQAELGMQAAAGRMVTHAHDIIVILLSEVLVWLRAGELHGGQHRPPQGGARPGA